MLATVTPVDEGRVEVTDPLAGDASVDDMPVPEGELPMKPSEGVDVGVPCDDLAGVASVLEGAVVSDGIGLDTSVKVCVVMYVPPRSSLIVLNATPPVISAHCNTVTVKVESCAEDTAVPCRLCNSRWRRS